MSDKGYSVLFICTGNSERSILAEGLMTQLGGARFRAFSAGSHPNGTVNPFALSTLKQFQVPIDGFRSKSWDEFSNDGAPPLSVVITVCDSAAAETCPVFFGGSQGQPVKVHWGYPEPSNAEGGEVGRRRAFELTRQAIGYRMLQLLALPLKTMDRAALQTALVDIGCN